MFALVVSGVLRSGSKFMLMVDNLGTVLSPFPQADSLNIVTIIAWLAINYTS